MTQLSFATLDHRNKKKQTKRKRFLSEMDAVVPWAKLLGLIEPHYPKAGKGRRPYPLDVMLRIYFLQQWYQLSDPGAEEALYDIQSMRAFAGLELGRDAIPDETTILNFRHLLEAHDLTKAIFDAVSAHLEEQGALLRGGTIMDATLIAASPSTKNKDGKRDPEMSQSKKGNQWYFGMKPHIGHRLGRALVATWAHFRVCRRRNSIRGFACATTKTIARTFDDRLPRRVRETLISHLTPPVLHSRASAFCWQSAS